MNLLSDIITYVRRIIKSPSNSVITDNLIIDYINRFWIMDVDARIQLFDLKTKYQFLTTPGIDQYNMPLYSVQTEPGNQTIGMFPVYQGFMGPCRADGIEIQFLTSRDQYFNSGPNALESVVTPSLGNGTNGPYTLQLPFFPPIPGHIDITGIIATGVNQDPPIVSNFLTTIPTTNVFSNVYFTATDDNGQNIVVADSGQFLSGDTGGDLYGLLMQPGLPPLGNAALPNGGSLPLPYATTQNTINYNTGIATNVYFPESIPVGNQIRAQCFFFEQGIPRSVLYYNNVIQLRNPPDTQYLIELTAYLSPAAFLNTANAIPFGYMAEYIARGAARKILSDTGDTEQFQFYEPLFREQEILVWKRSQRQFTSSRTQTIFANGDSQGNSNFTGFL